MENESPIQQVTAARDLAALQASEILGLHAVDLMTAAAVKLGLYEGGDDTRDLADARILIHVLAGPLTEFDEYFKEAGMVEIEAPWP